MFGDAGSLWEEGAARITYVRQRSFCRGAPDGSGQGDRGNHGGQPEEQPDEDVKGLSVFAAQAGIAIEDVKLYKRFAGRIEAADDELRQKITALTEMENFNDSILQNVGNGLLTADLEGRIVYSGIQERDSPARS